MGCAVFVMYTGLPLGVPGGVGPIWDKISEKGPWIIFLNYLGNRKFESQFDMQMQHTNNNKTFHIILNFLLDNFRTIMSFQKF